MQSQSSVSHCLRNYISEDATKTASSGHSLCIALDPVIHRRQKWHLQIFYQSWVTTEDTVM